jgi:transcriptional regulator with XRE-family HTH domain
MTAMNNQEAIGATKRFSLKERREALRRFRKQARLSLKALGAMANVSESMLSKFESGDRDLSPDAFARVQEAITDVLSEKRATEKLAALRTAPAVKRLGVPLSSIGQVLSVPGPSPEQAMMIDTNLAIGRRLAELEKRGLTSGLVNTVEKRVAEKLQDIAERKLSHTELITELWMWIVELEGDVALLEDRVNKRDALSKELVDDALKVKA